MPLLHELLESALKQSRRNSERVSVFEKAEEVLVGMHGHTGTGYGPLNPQSPLEFPFQGPKDSVPHAADIFGRKGFVRGPIG